MNVHELTKMFQQMRDCGPESVNELLDFTKKAYIQNVICITEYRKLVRELEEMGAEIPEFS